MFSSNMLYLFETILTALTILIAVLIFEYKNKKGLIKFLGIVLALFIAVFGTTFVLEKPQMHVKEIEDIEVKSEKKVQPPYTFYHFKDVTNDVKIEGNLDYEKIGEYEIKFVIDTTMGKYSEKAKVKIVDTKKPEIILEGEEKSNISYKNEYIEPGFKAIDEYEGDITNNVTITKEEVSNTQFNMLYEVSDESGNKAEKRRQINVIDDVPPSIKLNGNAKITVYLNGKYQENGATAEDEIDGNLTEKISVSGKVDTSKEGTYTITYTVSDNSGNEAKKERVITVKKQPVVSKVKAQDGSSGNKGVIYLTFDDGPSTNITPKVLDILKEKNVKATFFILNYNSEGEKLVKRAYNEGHTIAIHGYSHDYNQIYQSEEIYMDNLNKLQDKIKKSIGYTAKITRFPGGSSNTISRFNPGIMSRLCKLVVEKGYKYFDWNVSSGDAGGAKTTEAIYNNVIKGLSKNKQNVVLMHDFSSNSKLLKALPDIIDYGIANGYTFSRITEDTPMVTHTPNN